MARDNINDILVFLAIARERSFTKAAFKLGMTQSAVSHIIRGLEKRLGVRLLSRTTRSVSPTEAGERLLHNVGPRLDEIEQEIASISDLGDKPSGLVRITSIDHVIDNFLWPRLAKVLLQYPDIQLEISSDYRMVDIAAERFDIGVRWGDQVDKDMVAVRITPEIQMMIVGSPDYFAHRPVPASVQDLLKQNCIQLRMASTGGVYTWKLQHDGRDMDVRVRGQFMFNGVYQMVNAAISGCGLAFVTDDLASEHVRDGRLVSVMADWCPRFPGLYAYYPSRRHSSRAVGLVIDAIRHKSGDHGDA